MPYEPFDPGPGGSAANYPGGNAPWNSGTNAPGYWDGVYASGNGGVGGTAQSGGGASAAQGGNGSQNLNDFYLASDGHLYRATRSPQTGSITGYEDGGVAVNGDGSYADLSAVAGSWGVPVALLTSEVQKQHAAALNVAQHNVYQNVEYAGPDANGNDTYTVQMPDGTRKTHSVAELLQNGAMTQQDLDRIKQDALYRQSRESQQNQWQDIQYVGPDPNGQDTYSVMLPNGTHQIVLAAAITANGAATQADLDRIKANQQYSNNRIAQGNRLQNIRANGDGSYTVTNPDGSRTVMQAAAIIASGSANAEDLKYLDQQKTQQDLDYARQTSLATKYSNITYGGAGQYSATDYYGNHQSFAGADMNGNGASPPSGSLSSPTSAGTQGSLSSPTTGGGASQAGSGSDVGMQTKGGAGGLLTTGTGGGPPGAKSPAITPTGGAPPPASTLTSSGSATDAELAQARNQWAQQASAADRLQRMGQSRYGQGMGFAGSTPSRFIGQ